MDVTVSPCSAFSLKNTNSPRNGCCFVRCMLYSVYSRHAWKQISCVQWWKRRVLRSGFEEGGRLLKMKIQIFSNKRIYAMAYVTTIIFGEKLASLSMIYYCVHGTVDHTVECSMPISGRRKNVYIERFCV